MNQKWYNNNAVPDPRGKSKADPDPQLGYKLVAMTRHGFQIQ